MPEQLVRRIDQLPLPARRAVEELLGRALADDEEVSIQASRPHDAPQGPARKEAWDRLSSHLDLMSSKVTDTEELERIVDDACDEARHRQ